MTEDYLVARGFLPTAADEGLAEGPAGNPRESIGIPPDANQDVVSQDQQVHLPDTTDADHAGADLEATGALRAPASSIVLMGGSWLYTAEHGPVQVAHLQGKVVTVIATDLDTGVLTACRVRIEAAGTGAGFAFGNGSDGLVQAPAQAGVVLRSGRVCSPRLLKVGHTLRVASARLFNPMYVRISYRGSKVLLHRLVASDVLGLDVEGRHVHHLDGNGLNNAPDNLRVLEAAEHARLHVLEAVAAGQHVFQQRRFPKVGTSNPMHRDSDFWKDTAKAATYRKAKSAEMAGRNPRALQKQAILQRYMNAGCMLLRAGHDLSTLEGYFRAWEIEIGRVDSKPRRARRFEEIYGSYEAFYAQLLEVYDDNA